MKSDSLLETQRVQAGLKALLKTRGYSYQHLARELEVSLPTVKRMLTSDDISIGRIAKICSVVGIGLHEFLEVTRSRDEDIHYFSEQQEIFFAANPSYLQYLVALHNVRDTPAEIEQICKLSKRSTQIYLSKLSEMGLIRVLSNGAVKVRIHGLIGWDDRGPLGKVLTAGTIREMSERAIFGASEDCHLQLSGRMLTSKQYEMMRNEFHELTAKYRRFSKANSVAKERSQFNRYEIMIVADRFPLNRYKEICELP